VRRPGRTLPLLTALALTAALAWPVDAALARRVGRAPSAPEDAGPVAVPAAGSIEVAFSPDEGSEGLVIKVIDSARSELRVMAYTFTSAPVTRALLRARKRGVDVRLVVDERSNTTEDRSGKARAALSALVDAGVQVRTIGVYAIAHDKVLIADASTVELGSFNYSDAAAHRNSENVLVNWHNPQLARVYLAHFERNYRQSVAYETRY
jgi:phosphatidylserine/phosphatidylglycerophosphate/cardiolipin synthase-like enzyme